MQSACRREPVRRPRPGPLGRERARLVGMIVVSRSRAGGGPLEQDPGYPFVPGPTGFAHDASGDTLYHVE